MHLYAEKVVACSAVLYSPIYCGRAALVEAFRRARCKDDALNSTLGGAMAAYALVGIHRECRAERPTLPR